MGCGRLRGAAIVYTNGWQGPLRASLGRLCTLLCRRWPRGHNSVHRWEVRASGRQIGAFVYTIVSRATSRGRDSVHRWKDRTSPRRFEAFVYTIELWAWAVGGLGIAGVYTDGRIGPLHARLGRLCTLLGCELWAASRRATFRRRRRAARARQSRRSASRAWLSHHI